MDKTNSLKQEIIFILIIIILIISTVANMVKGYLNTLNGIFVILSIIFFIGLYFFIKYLINKEPKKEVN